MGDTQTDRQQCDLLLLQNKEHRLKIMSLLVKFLMQHGSEDGSVRIYRVTLNEAECVLMYCLSINVVIRKPNQITLVSVREGYQICDTEG
jgi:hypothetical protein